MKFLKRSCRGRHFGIVREMEDSDQRREKPSGYDQRENTEPPTDTRPGLKRPTREAHAIRGEHVPDCFPTLIGKVSLPSRISFY